MGGTAGVLNLQLLSHWRNLMGQELFYLQKNLISLFGKGGKT